MYVILLALVLYGVFWAIARRNQPPVPPSTPKRGPVGPDDDEDFLRELERKRRHQRDDPAT